MRVKSFLAAALIAGTSLIASTGIGLADEIQDKAVAYAKANFGFLSDPVVVSAIKAQNDKNAGLAQGDIDALDKTWRAEVKDGGTGPMVEGVLGNALSKYLAGVKEQSAGVYTEIFVMDNKGLNVGQSDRTSDYWQGDEAKWQKTFLVGPDAVHVSDVEKDESTQTFQVQVSVAIVDGGAVIGAATIGMDAEALE